MNLIGESPCIYYTHTLTHTHTLARTNTLKDESGMVLARGTYRFTQHRIFLTLLYVLRMRLSFLQPDPSKKGRHPASTTNTAINATAFHYRLPAAAVLPSGKCGGQSQVKKS